MHDILDRMLDIGSSHQRPSSNTDKPNQSQTRASNNGGQRTPQPLLDRTDHRMDHGAGDPRVPPHLGLIVEHATQQVEGQTDLAMDKGGAILHNIGLQSLALGVASAPRM